MSSYKLKNLRNPNIMRESVRLMAQNDSYIVGDIPGIKLRGAGVVSGLKMRKELIKNGTLNTENLSPTAKNLSVECLGSLCISVEVDNNPSYSFLTDSSNSYDRKTKEKQKDDASSIFPEANDPWHEHDESPAIGEKQLLDSQLNIGQQIKPQALLDTIYKINIKSKKLNQSVILPQLRQQGI